MSADPEQDPVTEEEEEEEHTSTTVPDTDTTNSGADTGADGGEDGGDNGGDGGGGGGGAPDEEPDEEPDEGPLPSPKAKSEGRWFLRKDQLEADAKLTAAITAELGDQPEKDGKRPDKYLHLAEGGLNSKFAGLKIRGEDAKLELKTCVALGTGKHTGYLQHWAKVGVRVTEHIHQALGDVLPVDADVTSVVHTSTVGVTKQRTKSKDKKLQYDELTGIELRERSEPAPPEVNGRQLVLGVQGPRKQLNSQWVSLCMEKKNSAKLMENLRESALPAAIREYAAAGNTVVEGGFPFFVDYLVALPVGADAEAYTVVQEEEGGGGGEPDVEEKDGEEEEEEEEDAEVEDGARE